MSKQPGASIPQRTDSYRGPRLLGLAAVAAGLLLLMAAAFVLSYAGIHAVALSAGVSARFARIYPVIFDAMLVIACAAVLALRGAGLPSRCYAWLTTLVLLAGAAGADTLHATNTNVPHKVAAATAAIIPWALVLIGFGLLLAMLRHARLRRAAQTAGPGRTSVQPSGHVQVRHGIDDLLGPRSSDGLAVGQLARKAGPAEPPLGLADYAEPGLDDPASDGGHAAARPGTSWDPAARDHQPADRGPAPAFSTAPTVTQPDGTEDGLIPEPAPVPEDGPIPEPGPLPEPGPAPAADPVPGAGPTAEDRAVPEVDEEPGEPEASPAAEAEPRPAVPVQFDRMRSSPLPPE
jgi:outer membrane biosynthesis protein TonB